MSDIYGFAINVEGNAVKSITAIDSSLNALGAKGTTQTAGIAKGFIMANVAMQAFNKTLQAGRYIYDTGVQLEQTRIAFDVLLGSTEKGLQMFNELKQFADITPFDNQTTYDAAKQLMNYGVAAENVIPYMNLLGDISGGNADRFNRLAYVFGQVSAQGRLTGQDLRQMIDAGFNPLNEISKETGQSYSDLRDELSKGNISFTQVVDIMKKATGEGGRFNNLMVKQSQTVGGLASTIVGNMQTAAYGVFQAFSPTLKTLYSETIDLTKAFTEWVTPKQSEILSDQRFELNAMIDTLKAGNLSTEARSALIADMNSKYPDYLKNINLEKAGYEDLAKLQDNVNQGLQNKITLTAHDEILNEYKNKWAKKSAEIAEMNVWLNKIQSGYEPTIAEKLMFGSGILQGGKPKTHDTTWEEYFQYRVEAGQEEERLAKEQYQKTTELFKNQEAWIYVPPKTSSKTGKQNVNTTGMLNEDSEMVNAIKNDAKTTSNLVKSGKLGEANIINLNFNEPLMQINADSIDGESMKENGEKTVQMITRELVNLSHESGIM
jgi:tape measure domain-containing protein